MTNSERDIMERLRRERELDELRKDDLMLCVSELRAMADLILVERDAAVSARDTLSRQVQELREALWPEPKIVDGVSITYHANWNLDGAMVTLQRLGVGGPAMATLLRLRTQLERAEAAISSIDKPSGGSVDPYEEMGEEIDNHGFGRYPKLDTPQVAGAGCDPSVKGIAKVLFQLDGGEVAKWESRVQQIYMVRASLLLPFIHAAERRGIEKAAELFDKEERPAAANAVRSLLV